jgi:hypothetical protein
LELRAQKLDSLRFTSCFSFPKSVPFISPLPDGDSNLACGLACFDSCHVFFVVVVLSVIGALLFNRSDHRVISLPYLFVSMFKKRMD